MSLAIDSREMGVMGFREQEIKKDGIMAARGFPGFLGTRFHGKHGWVREEKGGERLAGFHVGSENDDFSSGSSSIGVCSNSTVDDADNEEEGEVQSRFRSPLDRLDSLEDSLPIKRGLSNYFSGKAKSFGCLSDADSVEDLSKTENPLNKRRRILLACKNGARIPGELRSNSSAFRQKSLLEEKIVEEEERSKGAGEEEEDRGRSEVCVSPLPQNRKLRSFISPRSYSLSNLHREG